jgi:hypothetical protein
MKNKIIWIKGTNEHFKEKILFKCDCEVKEDRLFLGYPFIKGYFHLDKFKENNKENPFNYIIAIDTYEKVKNRENPLKEFYAYFEEFINNLEEEIKENCREINKDISSDYKSINFYFKDNRAINSLRININRKSITKLSLYFENPFNRERIEQEYNKNEIVYFKEKLNEFKEIVLKIVEESKKENPYFKEVLSFFNSFKEYDTTDFYEISLRCNEYLDRLSIYFIIENYQIPLKFNDGIKDYSKSKRYFINIEEDKIYLQNGSQKIEEKYLENFDSLKEFILKKVEEIKESNISKIKAREELNKLQEEENKKNKLTEEKFKNFCERFKEGDKITIFGIESLFGKGEIEGRIYKLDKENKSFFVIVKGKRNRGLSFKIGSWFEIVKKGYL